jgi:hypothetical protein
MTTVQNYFNIAEGQFAQSLLEASGIDAILLDESSAWIVGMTFASGGLRLQVPEEDEERAMQILARHTPEADASVLDPEPEPETEAPEPG